MVRIASTLRVEKRFNLLAFLLQPMRRLQEVRQARRHGILRYYCSWIGAPWSKDMNASHGGRSKLTTIIRNESRQIYSPKRRLRK
jgi:hypothetical protein